jgi:hypothetical protein
LAATQPVSNSWPWADRRNDWGQETARAGLGGCSTHRTPSAPRALASEGARVRRTARPGGLRAPAAFLTRASCCDFAPEGYEATWTRRATPADLTDMGRKQLGLQPW